MCVDVTSDVKLPLQEVLVAADVLQQSEELLAGPSEELLAGPSEELLAGPSAPSADRQPDDSHHLHQEESAFQQAAAVPAGPSVTTVNGLLEHHVALQQADTQVDNFGLWF